MQSTAAHALAPHGSTDPLADIADDADLPSNITHVTHHGTDPPHHVTDVTHRNTVHVVAGNITHLF